MILLYNILKHLFVIVKCFFHLFILGNYYKYINFYKKRFKGCKLQPLLVNYANFSNAYVKNPYQILLWLSE